MIEASTFMAPMSLTITAIRSPVLCEYFAMEPEGMHSREFQKTKDEESQQVRDAYRGYSAVCAEGVLSSHSPV